jgi:hypothetical protein
VSGNPDQMMTGTVTGPLFGLPGHGRENVWLDGAAM